MATVTSPIILDSTGQDIKTSIDLLTANINRTASNIPYDNNLTIKGKIDAIDLTEGGTVNGNLSVIGNTLVQRNNNYGIITLGKGSNSSEFGILQLWDKNSHYANLRTLDNLGDNREFRLPNKAGTIALTDDVTFKTLNRNAWNWNTVTSHSIEAYSGNPVIVFGGRSGKGFMAICPSNNNEVYTISNNIGCTISQTYEANTGKHTITFSNPTSTVGTSVVVTAIG